MKTAPRNNGLLEDISLEPTERAFAEWAAIAATALERLRHDDHVFPLICHVGECLPVLDLAHAIFEARMRAVMIGILDIDHELDGGEPHQFGGHGVACGAPLVAPRGHRPATMLDQRGVKDFALRPYQEVVEDFKARRSMTKAQWNQLSAPERRKAFTIANTQSADFIEVVRAHVQSQLELGITGAKDFLATLNARLIEAGYPPSTRTTGQITPSHVALVQRQAVATAYSNARKDRQSSAAVMKTHPYWEYRGVRDKTTRQGRKEDSGSNHMAAFGIIVRADDPIWRTAYPPNGFNCFVGETIVQGRFIGGSRAWYEGKAIELTTREGRRLTTTPNHSVATSKGMVAASALREGADLLAYRGDVHRRDRLPVDDHEHHEPARIDEVLGALAATLPSGTATAISLDFHGDAMGFKGQIDVVGTYRQLLRGPEVEQLEGELRLPSSDALGGQDPLVGAGHRLSSGRLVGPTTDSVVGGLHLRPALDLGHARPLDGLSFGLAARHYAMLAQDATDGVARDSLFMSDLIDRGAGLIALDELVGVREVELACHVYDLETPAGWLVGNGIIASNCRCGILARRAGPSAPGASYPALAAFPDKGYEK